jgi:hypothetical protein
LSLTGIVGEEVFSIRSNLNKICCRIDSIALVSISGCCNLLNIIPKDKNININQRIYIKIIPEIIPEV